MNQVKQDSLGLDEINITKVARIKKGDLIKSPFVN
jgi:hypothetical protein